jgi:hypothetical protein
MKRLAFLVIAMAVIFGYGCATGYHKRGFSGGYRDYKITDDVYDVQFSANGYTPVDIVDKYLLYRCAELTVESGQKYFVILESNVQIATQQFTVPGSYQSSTSGSATAYGGYAQGSSQTHGTYTPPQTYQFSKPYGAAKIKVIDKRAEGAIDANEIIRNLGPSLGIKR